MMCTWFGSLGGAVGCCGFLGNRESDMFCLESEDRAWEEKQSLVEQKSPFAGALS